VIELALAFGVGLFVGHFVWWRPCRKPLDPVLVAGLARNVVETHGRLFEGQSLNHEATMKLIERVNDSNAKLAQALEPLELAARDWANTEQLPVEVPARCLPCKAPASIITSKLRGTNVYEITVPDGWTIVQEPPRAFTVFLLCPSCRPQYEDLIPNTIERPVE
jgi:hypothetical protein